MKQHFCTSNGPKAIGPYSTAVIHGDCAYLSGMVPVDPSSGTVVEGGIEAQTQRVMENISIALDELGLSLCDVVKSTIFVTDLDAFAQVNATYKAAFDSSGVSEYPARSCVQVSRLPLGVNIEIEVIAAIKK